MGITDRTLGWFRGETGRSDHDGSEQVAFVRPYEAPALQQILSQNDIPCEIVKGRNHPTWEPMVVLMVPSAEREHALDVIGRFKES